MVTQRTVVLVACLGTLAGCAPRRADLPPTGAPPAVRIPAGAQVLRIDPERSAVTILVRRAGPLARLGHNHVIVSSAESGRAWLGRSPAESGFEIRLPVGALVVDDPRARAGAGPEFAGELPDAAREGTRDNLMRAEVLDAQRHPDVLVQAVRLQGGWERPVAATRITLRGATREVAVPFELGREGGTVSASGSLRLLQSDLGMTPFSIGGGVVQVADELEIRFEFVAVPD